MLHDDVRRRSRVPAVLALALLLLTGLTATASGPPSPGPERTVTYEVRTRGAVQADLGVFRRVAATTFNDRRGWSLGGSLTYREVGSGGSFTLWLAAPSAMTTFSRACSSEYSCRVGRDVVINDERWRQGTTTWPDVREYRRYVLNHELGHWLGLRHTSCTSPGTHAPVMQQQSESLDGCTSNTWPLDGERRSVAQRQGVSLRSERPHVYAVTQQGASGTEVHVLDGGSDLTRFVGHHATALGATDPAAWEFAVADRDRDGVDDVVGVLRSGASGRTEVHVLDGASGYRAFQLHAATALHPTTADGWSFDVADVDADGVLDVVAFAFSGGSGSTEVHVLDGASDYTRWLSHAATALHPVDRAGWALRTGDHDRDGWVDVYAIARSGPSGRTQVTVLDGATGWQRSSADVATALHAVDGRWEFAVEDLQGDGHTTVYAVLRDGASDRTEVHVLDDVRYDSFVLHTATALHPTAEQPHWRFAAD